MTADHLESLNLAHVPSFVDPVVGLKWTSDSRSPSVRMSKFLLHHWEQQSEGQCSCSCHGNQQVLS